MKLIDHVYAIRNLLSKGVSSDDSAFSLKFIAHLLIVNRANLIKRNNSMAKDYNFQALCLTLEEDALHKCCTTQSSCKILKSTKKLPRFLGNYRVTTLDGDPIYKLSATEQALLKYAIQPVKAVFYSIENEHLVIYGNKDLEAVVVQGVLENPLDLGECEDGSDNCDASLFNVNFTIEAHLLAPLYELTLQQLRQAFSLPAKDDINDNKDNQVTAR